MAKRKVEAQTDYSADQSGIARAFATLVMSIATSVPERQPERDSFFLNYVASEPIIAGAVYVVATQTATARYRLSGPPDRVALAREVLARAELGAGFAQFVASVVRSALTTESGGWFEIVRPAVAKGRPVFRVGDDWLDEKGAAVDPVDVQIVYPSLPITFFSLDPLRCEPTGDPSRPLRYHRADGTVVELEWYQCGRITDLPVPGSRYASCAVGRAISAVRLMTSVLRWHLDRVSGNLARMLVISNASPRAIQSALEDAAKSSVAAGMTQYVPPVFVSPLEPTAQPAAEIIRFADLPEGFNFSDFKEWYITAVANCFGIDYGALAPLPGSRLGTATEAEVMARFSSRRGPGYLQKQIAHALNTLGILPEGVTFEFVVSDYAEEEQRAKAALLRAQERAKRIESGELTPAVARQLAADCGDLPVEYLALFGESDYTPEHLGSASVSQVDMPDREQAQAPERPE